MKNPIEEVLRHQEASLAAITKHLRCDLGTELRERFLDSIPRVEELNPLARHISEALNTNPEALFEKTAQGTLLRYLRNGS